ncbi:MAG: UDP-N-acetylmuramate--L-alanine ligase [Thiovulaceae bacterium]|nr:UDP-N-acetylmuramate--L-alanine ligase [Sulfurimonadaceae bacterium]
MKIHFIGIGGIGISALAKYMHACGHEISGSDMKASLITEYFSSIGCQVNIGHDESVINDHDMVVYSAVVKPSNVERKKAEDLGITTLCRRDFLPTLVKDKEVYAVCGAHGKSTTTAILASIMSGSAIIGAESKGFGSNMRYDGDTNRILFEADESDGSFLNANASVAIVTNAEPEHMEYYDHDEKKFYKAYETFLNNAPTRVINAEDPFLAKLEIDAIKLYPSRDLKDIEFTLIDDEPHTSFTLKDFGQFHVWGFGEHIAVDAALAILAALHSGMDIENIRTNLGEYKGIKKRFDIISKNSTILIDDYAHHPTEIKATFESIVTYAKLKGIDTITTIWQPHKYSRTIDNMDAFKSCFTGTHHLVILPVWSAGESVVDIDFAGEFSAYKPLFVDTIKRDKTHLDLLRGDEIVSTLDKGLIVGFGAGDITYQLRGDH